MKQTRQTQFFVMLSDQGRTEEVDSFLTKREALGEAQWLAESYEKNQRYWYHLANPYWYVVERDVEVDERDHHGWACANYPNGW